MVEAALCWATELHSGQLRDGDKPLPYIFHPIAVCSLVHDVGGVADTDMLCACILHDTVEECGVSLDEIRERFGRRTAKLVGELTREEPSPVVAEKLTKDELYVLRNEMLLDGIRQMGDDAKLIKLADRICNLQEARRTRTGGKLERYRKQSVQILELIERGISPPLWDLLKQTIELDG